MHPLAIGTLIPSVIVTISKYLKNNPEELDHTTSREDNATDKDRLAKTLQARNVVSLRHRSIA